MSIFQIPKLFANNIIDELFKTFVSEYKFSSRILEKKFLTEENEGLKSLLKCYYCSKLFKSVNSRDHHMYVCYAKSVDAGKPITYPCEQCNATYTSKGRLNQHLRYDCGRSHICKFCNRNFSESSSLKRHLRAGICTNLYLQL